MPVSASATTLTLLCLLAAAGAAPPADDIVSRVRHHNFGMYSYSYTQSTSATTELTAFAKKYGLRDILQYVCGGIHLMPPGRFANFVNRVGEGSGATVTAMFDRTQWGTDTSPYSIVAKLKWYKAVRSILIGTYNNHYSLAGVTFDIEDLSPQHYVTLTSYAEDQWNTLVPRDAWAHETISFQLGSKEDSTAAKIVSGDIVDRIYWENYRNTEAEVFDFADNMLNQVDPTGNGEAVLAVENVHPARRRSVQHRSSKYIPTLRLRSKYAERFGRGDAGLLRPTIVVLMHHRFLQAGNTSITIDVAILVLLLLLLLVVVVVKCVVIVPPSRPGGGFLGIIPARRGQRCGGTEG